MKTLKDLNGHSTITELMQVITCYGGMIKTDADAVCLYQDIIGHSTIEELTAIANGTQKETFYRLYDIAHGTTATIKFYLQVSEKIQTMIADLDYYKGETECLRAENEKVNGLLEKSLEGHATKADEWNTEKQKLLQENASLTVSATVKDNEITELKAKLYDLLTK